MTGGEVPVPQNGWCLRGDKLTCVRGERTVFSGISLTLEPGKPVVLTGPNGAGKSSLIRTLAGLIPMAAGERLLYRDGNQKSEDALQDHLIYIGHQDPVKSALTVYENLAFWKNLYGARASVDSALAKLGLSNAAPHPAGLLSAGQRRRLVLCRLALTDRPIWLLDEPLTSLDTRSRQSVLALIEQHCSKGGLTLISSHESLELTNAIPHTLVPEVSA